MPDISTEPSRESPPGRLTLAIDIGGSHLKAGVLDPGGGFLAGPGRVETPHPADPASVLAGLDTIIGPLGRFHQVSVGFPGVIRHGVVLTAPNLGTKAWHGFGLAQALSSRLGSPVRVLNDASVQGLGVISGQGLECVITLGTGFGFALFEDGRIAPHLEVGQHIARGKRTYDLYLGAAALEAAGRRKWNARLGKAIAALETLVSFDTLYIGGGNAKSITIELPPSVRVVSNEAGILGGIKLWDPRLEPFFPEAPSPLLPAAAEPPPAPRPTGGRRAQPAA